MRIQALCVALCALAPVAATASGGGLDLHYTPLATFGDVTDETALKGDGYGARLNLEFGSLLAHVEYSTAAYPLLESLASDDSIDQLRAGLGLQAGEAVSLHAEYHRWKFVDNEFDGYGGHIQFSQSAKKDAGAYLRLGYLSLESNESSAAASELEGFEYAVGTRFPLGSIRGLLEFRSTHLEDQDGLKAVLEDVHVGLSVPFGKVGKDRRRRRR